MKTKTDRTLRLIPGLVVLVSFILFQFAGVAQALPLPGFGVADALDSGKISPALQDSLASLGADQTVSVIVRLRDKASLVNILDRRRSVRLRRIILALKATANRSQPGVKFLLAQRKAQGKVARFESYWIFNGFSVTTGAGVIRELANRPEVASISPDETFQAPVLADAGPQPEPNINLVNAPDLWNLGYQGNGIVVANVDTGVYLNHPDLAPRWRGGTNSWFDPNGEHPDQPFDVNGHGTWTMGVMAGGAGETAVGVAPGAQWIAVKIFNDRGVATTSGIHAAYQWLLDPDGDPSTDDAPHVVNSSWAYSSPGCSLEFEGDLQALRAAGILPVFAAGNSGPYPAANVSPANNPSAFAVGATTNSDQIYSGSGRGPSSCGENETIFPEMVAPGVNIRSTDLYGLYSKRTGTSLAAPHVAGGLALLLSAYPNLTDSEQQAALLNGLVDLGPVGPDPDFGYGRLDLWASIQWLDANQGQSTATPTLAPVFTPTATDTPLPPPSPTNTPLPLLTATDTPLPPPSPTNTPLPPPTATDTPLPAPTATPTSLPPTSTPTDAPLPTPTNTPLPSGNLLYLSFVNGGSYTIGAVSGVSDEDILSFDGSSFALVFDGSDAGVGNLNLDAFHFINDTTLLLSFDKAATISGVGAVDDSDILRFDAVSLGPNTAGTFSLFFDGPLAGLSEDNEDVDAVGLLPDGSLIVSVTGKASVPGLGGTWQDEDLLAFTPSTPGDYTSGTWSVYFDGSDVGLSNSSEDVNGVSLAANGDIVLTTTGNFSVNGISGADEDAFVCQSPVTGPATVCAFSSVLFFDGSALGLASFGLDALALP